MNISRSYNKENWLPTPEPSSDNDKYAAGLQKPALPALPPRPALPKVAHMNHAIATNPTIFATPPPSSPLRSQSPAELASSPPAKTFATLAREESNESVESAHTTDLFASPTRTLVLGRGRKNWTNAQKRLEIPLSPKIDRIRHYVFPSSFSHISRTHLSIYPNVKQNSFNIRILGQNGIKLNGRHFSKGTRLRVSKNKDDGLAISCLMPHKLAKKPRYKLVMKSRAKQVNLTIGDTKLALHWSDLVHHKSILSDCESDESETEMPTTPSKRKRRSTPSDITEEVSQEHLGLIAQTLALNVPTSLTPIKEIASCLLNCNPSLEKEASLEEWEDIVQRTLLNAPGQMFGCVERSGRDAANRPLPNLYYYQPSNDPDRIRAQSLAPLTRVPRQASRAGQAKQVFWKPVSIRPKKKW
ncbi:hypothetical protein WALSEDRAFT_68398 [Wallemia mellicola CBS 633.66]|uniref:FHA domain-containing protein n=2 Tax=Wallemia mellicola TaxID=1708541 RepID=A0A4T0NKI5_9BASI|nr:hypothetical protein WALSEDRAFT_68398 [Wallemia mellicola CBS 633.66]TIB70422.1 hypothetical protein E3Q24_02923 [Wallemia mellicola]EIM22444.1 hypothetical protein WALSEDRAFT_68398 [Wallemia mellicola CBS 633.66]TIB75592.1 hypothetical protein E3Q23_02295 [Wallemia mellicola]TIB83006.1 hypothetical protein E3Q21_03115 [Wallemia mellicola]TIB85762.1 hypothetical protein E3Q20_03107 [Wallemia mellicola]|eukprot:XP_006957685.1 hypothetical protein WALSEDRAFT_68398 [Wallemia mellicola CBS 633.66]